MEWFPAAKLFLAATLLDATQLDLNKHDPKAIPEGPRGFHVDVRFGQKTRLMPLAETRTYAKLTNMPILACGSRLSIAPIEPAGWRFILARLGGRAEQSPGS